jgi:flagellar biosynthesis protein FlhA
VVGNVSLTPYPDRSRRAVYAFAALLLAVVGILIVPLPPWLLDLLLGINIFGSALVLLLSVTVDDPLEFSAFAPALLVATLFRLSLDVSATRLILTHGDLPGAVGSIIPAFGAFVVGGNLVVGIIVFAILVTIQFVVIASGSQRVAEVAARFTLDAMPGKQMAIDADVHAGVLDSEGARCKREAVQREADFYGAMDGAGKFVKGDAVAALIIVVLNLVGGVVVGIAYHGLSPLQALDTFALLSIGNALVTTLPAFLISTAMGMMVTRVASDGALGSDLAAQLFTRPEVLRSAGGLLLALMLVPALPRPLFAVLGAGAFIVADAAQRRRKQRETEAADARERAKRNAMRRPELALGLVGVDAITIEIGAELAQLLALPLSDALLDRIGEVRRALAADVGVVLPGVRLRDDLARDPRTYGIRVRDRLVGAGRLDLERFLAVADESILTHFAVPIEREPVYGLPAAWIAAEDRDRAVNAGALVFDPISVLASHLAEIARLHAAELVGRQELQTLLEHLRSTVPALVKEVGGETLPFGALHRAFTLLLRESAWPRDPVAVLEAMLEAGTRDPRELAEAARRAIVPDQLRRRGLSALEPAIFDPEFERKLAACWSGFGAEASAPSTALAVRDRIEAYAARTPRDRAAVLCTATLRPLLADFLLRFGIRVSVYAYGELPNELALRPAEVIEERDALGGR